MTLFSPGTRVQMRHEVGTVIHVMGGGTVHEVELSNGTVIPCLGDVLKPCPDNVAILRAWGCAVLPPNPLTQR